MKKSEVPQNVKQKLKKAQKNCQNVALFFCWALQPFSILVSWTKKQFGLLKYRGHIQAFITKLLVEHAHPQLRNT